jgi:hypothetical protein
MVYYMTSKYHVPLRAVIESTVGVGEDRISSLSSRINVSHTTLIIPQEEDILSHIFLTLLTLCTQGTQPSGKTGKTGKMMKNNSLQGKIREFVKKEIIREKSGNSTRETKKYEHLLNISLFV